MCKDYECLIECKICHDTLQTLVSSTERCDDYGTDDCVIERTTTTIQYEYCEYCIADLERKWREEEEEERRRELEAEEERERERQRQEEEKKKANEE